MHKPNRPANAYVRFVMRTAVALCALALVHMPTPMRADAETMEARAKIERERPKPRKVAGIRIASLDQAAPALAAPPSLSGQWVTWRASAECLNTTLRKVIDEVATNFGPVTINSTCRNPVLNAKVGGAKHSRHLTGDAADFTVDGDKRAVLQFLQGHHLVGGLKLYDIGYFHIDTGPRRTW